MLFTIFACIYISLVCWAWGIIFTRLLKKITGQVTELSFSITCITGLSFIISILGILSLFIPLGGWMIQLLFLLPSMFVLSAEYKSIFKQNVKDSFSLHPPSLFLLLISIMVILVMSTWKIIHPDTLGYHAQLIQWAEKYRVIPGLVNLNTRYGLQSNWFLACAFFSFKFTGSQALVFLNTAVLFWFILFIVNKINRYLTGNENRLMGFLWLFLLGFSFWSYTQIRLMATSASPDFFAVILVLTTLYIFVEKKEYGETTYYPGYFLITLFSATAITVKLSALPVLFIVALLFFFLLKQKKIKFALISAGIIFILLLPLLARNVITSGYPLFPSVYGSFPVDWKLGEETTRQIAGYVTVYSRTAISYTNPAVQQILIMKWTEWIPLWWKVLSTADKTIMCLLVLSIITAFAFAGKVFRSGWKKIISLVICFTGLVFWFILAPDPRFGFGFIVGFIGIICIIVFPENNIVLTGFIKKAATVSVLITGLLLSVYIVYRFKNFYSGNLWLKPMGTEKVEYKSVNCGGLKINIPLNNPGCGDTAIPCAYDSCSFFTPRGNEIINGFRLK